MANVTESTWTINLLPTAGTAGIPGHGDQVQIGSRWKKSYVRFDLAGNGDICYPSSGGMPIPTHNSTGNTGDTGYGMVRNVRHFKMIAAPAAGYLWQWVPSDQAIRGYASPPTTHTGATVFTELTTAVEVSEISTAGISFTFEVEGW